MKTSDCDEPVSNYPPVISAAYYTNRPNKVPPKTWF